MGKVYRDQYDKRIGGVCGGLAQYFQFDSSFIRLIFVLLAIVTGGLFLLVYLLCWLIFPKGPKSYVEATYKKLYRSRRDRRIAGLCGGFGQYFKVDSNFIRLGIVIIMFITGIVPILVAYLIGIAIVPEEPLRKR